MKNLRPLFLLVLILSTNFLEIEAKKHTRRHTFLLKSRAYSKNIPKKSNLVERKKTLLHKRTKSALKTKFADTFLLPLVILNTALSLITTIVNIGVKHQEHQLKNLKEKQLKRLYVFKSKADAIKRGTCLSIMRVVSIFGDLFDWLRIELFLIQIQEEEKIPKNVITGDFIYNEELSDEEKDIAENQILIENQSKLCLTNECLSQVIKVNSIDRILNSLRTTKNQIVEFQNTFCDLGEDLIGEEKYYNSRTMGILQSIYPKKSESNNSKSFALYWARFNDVMEVFEEITWVNQGIMDNYVKSQENLTNEMGKINQDPSKIKSLEEKLKNAEAGYNSNNLISDTFNQYLPNEFRNEEKTWSTFYVRHVIIGNPLYKSLGDLNSLKKKLWTKIKIFTGYEKLPDSDLGKKVTPTKIQKALVIFEIIEMLFPFFLFFLLVILFGFMGGNKIRNTFFSIFPFLNLVTEMFALGSAKLTIAIIDEKLDPTNTKYTSSANYSEIKKSLEKSKFNAIEAKKKARKGINWNLFLLIAPFFFNIAFKWLLRKLAKSVALSLVNGLLTGILVFKLVKNVTMLILAVRKYYELKSSIKKITADEDVEVKVRANYLGNLSVQLQYVFIKFNLLIYNGLSGFLSYFRSVIKDGNPILKDTIEEENYDSSYYNKEAESFFGSDYEKIPEEMSKRIEDSLPKIAAFNDSDGLKKSDFKNTLIVRYKPRQHFLMNLATENVNLVYRYKKYILNQFYEHNTNSEFLPVFKEQFDKFLNKLLFTAPIANPMIFKLSNFIETPSLLDNSDLYVMKHRSFPDDYICIYQKTFYSNSYLKGVKKYIFNFSGKQEDYNSFFQSVELIKKEGNLVDIYFMDNNDEGNISVVVFISWNTTELIDIDNFKVTRPKEANEIVFKNNVKNKNPNLKIISYFSENFYDDDNGEKTFVNSAQLEIDLSTLKISGYDPFFSFYEDFRFQQENGKESVDCKNKVLFSYYYIKCIPDKGKDKDIPKEEGYSKLLLCQNIGNDPQFPDEPRKNVMRRFLLPRPEMDSCDKNYVVTAPYVDVKNDTDEMNLILDLKTRGGAKTEEEKKNDPSKHIKEGENALEETVESFSLDIKKSACKQITRLKHVIYGCYTELIARKSEFSFFYEVKGDVSKFREFYMDNFLDSKSNKLVQPTLTDFREKFHTYIGNACGLESTTRQGMNDYTAFGFLYGHSDKPAKIDNLKDINKKLKDVNMLMTIDSLKGKYLFPALDKKKGCFEEMIVNTERRFLFPLKKQSRDNSLIFTVFYILPYKKEEDKKTGAVDYKVQLVYSLQDTNEEFLNRYNSIRETENSSIVRGLTLDSEDSSINTDNNDALAYTKKVAKVSMGPEALFKVFEYYYVEVWSSYSQTKDNLMQLVDEKGILEGLLDTGFVPFWPRTVPVITNDGNFQRNYNYLQYYYNNIDIPKKEGDPVPFDYLEFYEEFNATPDFFFFFQYNEGNFFGSIGFNSSKEKVIAYRLWVKFDFDMSKVEMELECPAHE